MERTNRNMSEPVGEFFETQSVSPPAQEGEMVVAGADGKGVFMRGGSSKTQKAGSDPTVERENSGGKKMAVVGSVGIYSSSLLS